MSYILIEFPAGASPITTKLLVELRTAFQHIDVRTRESMDGKYRVVEFVPCPNDAITNVNTGQNFAGVGFLATAGEIIYRLTGDWP
jgi:hypothetical protein